MHVVNAVHPSIPARVATALRTSAVLATALAALAASEAHSASLQRVERDFVADKGPVAVEVRVAGRSTALYNASARPDRWYLEARKGQKYEIRVRNTTGERIGFVLAVDGLNAIDGTLSRNASTEPMYVLEPYADATIKGWRRNLDQVSRFVFVDEQRSYAERTGQANGDLGWIRVTAFHEVWTVARTWGTIRGQYHDGGPTADGGADCFSSARASPSAVGPPSYWPRIVPHVRATVHTSWNAVTRIQPRSPLACPVRSA